MPLTPSPLPPLFFRARFTQAMNMLEYHGFIRGTKRKIDHVERLTWGSI
jgi:hypothetical protein